MTRPHASAWLRRAAVWGVQNGPGWFVRMAPTAIGASLALLLGPERRAVRRNLRWMGTESGAFHEVWTVTRTFIEFAHCLTRSMVPLGASQERPIVHGDYYLRELLSRPEGFVIVTAHVGPWDLASQALLLSTDRKVLVVMAEETSSQAAEVQDAIRGKAGVGVLRMGADPLASLGLVEHVQSGGIVALQVDRVPRGSRSVDVELWGRPFEFAAGPFLLAGMLGVALLPAFAARSDASTTRLFLGAPLYPSRRPRRAELESLAQRVARQLERHIQAFPEQWFHFQLDSSPKN